MKFTHWLFALACAVGVVGAGEALAARPATDTPSYPNTKRKDPKPQIAPAEQRSLERASDLVSEGKDEQAEPLVQKVIGNSRASAYARAFAHQLMAQIYYDRDDGVRAIEEYRKAVDLDALPNASQFQILYGIAQLQLQEERYADALATLAEWEQLTGSQTPDSLALKGNAYYRTDEYEKAIEAVKQAIASSDKEIPESWNQILMASYFELDRYDEAASMLEQQLQKDPDNMRLVNQLANIYIQADQQDKAIRVLSDARARGLVTDPEDIVQLAKLYAVADQPGQSATVLREALDAGTIPGDYENWKLLGDVCMQEDNESCAMEAYSKAAPSAPNGYVDYQLGYMYFYADRSSDAVDALTRAINRGGLNQEGEAYLLRGDANNDLDRSAAAMEDWRKAATFPSTRSMAEQRINAAQGGVKLRRGARPGR